MIINKKSKKNVFNITFRHIAAALIIIFSAAGVAQPAMASQSNQPVGFSVKAIRSDKQVDKKATYFDLLLTPGTEHVLEVDVYNNSDAPITATVNACTAGTNSGGVIDYDNVNVTDDSLIVSFADTATVDSPLINIPARGTERVKITVNMPDTDFDGIMLGGIAIKKAPEETVTEANETGIKNQYCYILGVRIRVNNSKVDPDFRLRYVEPTLSNYRTSIAANLQNFEPALVKGLKIDANVYYNNNPVTLYSKSKSNFDVAPNSNFDYIIPCNSKLKAGNYRLTLTATLGERVWEFEDEFTIAPAVASGINSAAVDVPAVDYYRIATIALSALLIALIIALIIWRLIGGKKRKEAN